MNDVRQAPRSVLVVEDDQDDLDLTLLALHPTIPPDLIDVARDGAEALEYLFRTGRYANRQPDHDPALIMLDLRMPVLDGLEVLKNVKVDPRLRTIPVVMLTASSNDNDILNSFKLGITGYIIKGADFSRFAATVNTTVTATLALHHPGTPAPSD
jgi:two-component system, response regulator